ISIGFVEGEHENSQLSYKRFLSDEIILVSHVSTHGELGAVDLVDLEKLPLIMREDGSGTLGVIHGALHECGVNFASLDVRMRLGSSESIKAVLSKLPLYSFLSRYAVERELASGEFCEVEVRDFSISRRFRVAYLKGPEPEGLAGHFLRFMGIG
ncbi:MAG: LysR substrate-binding domain-containing protein, partial [Lentisphaeria bacterium]